MAEDNSTVDEIMDLDTFQAMYRTPSVDKKTYWKQDVNGNVLSVPLQDTTVYNGNFTTQYLNRTAQSFTGVFVGIPGGIAATEGALIRDEGEAGAIVEKGKAILSPVPGLANLLDETGITENVTRFIGEKLDGSYEAHLKRSELLGEKLVNYGLYLSDIGKQIVAEMEEQTPTTNEGAKFLGDVTGSMLASIALYKLGGTGLATGVFSLSSAADEAVDALRSGQDADVSLAASLVTGVTVGALENLGLKAIFDRTARVGVKAISMHILNAIATEGLTESAQTGVEIGMSKAVGGSKEISLVDAISQMAYAGAVGAFAGGAMVGGVTLTQRHKGISLLEKTLGVDKTTATRVYNEAEQVGMEQVLKGMGEETGYDVIQNKKIQTLRDVIALSRGERGISNADAQRILDSLKIVTPGETLLNSIRAQAVADINAQIEEGIIGGKTVKGAKASQQAAEVVRTLEDQQAAEPETFVPITEETINNVKPIYRAAYIGRIKELTRTAKQAKNELMRNLKMRDLTGRTINTETINGNIATYLDATTELTYLKENPGDLVFTGDNQITLPNAEVLARIADKQTALILRNVKLNFLRGKQATRAEMEYVKGAIKQLLKRPGLSQSQRFEQLGRWLNNIRTPEQLTKRFSELESKVDIIIQQNLINTFKNSIDNAVKIMKGKGAGANRRVNLPASAQHLADVFVKALNQVDINPAETVNDIHTPEGFMRTLAARLATETNPDGSPLTPRDYMNIDRTLRDFISDKTLEFQRIKQIKKATIERQKEKVIADLYNTQKLGEKGYQKLWENMMSHISRRFNYDALISSLAKGMGAETGSSVFEATMDFNKAHIKKETLETYYMSRFIDGAKRIFDVKSSLELGKKLLRDRIGENDIILTKVKSDGTREVFWNGSIAEAREKYMLWLSPEGQTIMQKRGWTEGEIEALVDNLSVQDIEFVNLQLEIYNEVWPVINETFRKTQGYDLGYRHQYSPIYRDGIDFGTSNMIDQLLGRGSQSPDMQNVNFLKELTLNDKKLKDVADFEKLRHYIRDASHYAAFAEKVDEVQRILHDSDVKEKIEQVRDKDFYHRLKNYVDILANNKRYGNGNLNSIQNNFVTNMQKMLIAGKVVLFPKQLVSSLAALEVVTPKLFSDAMTDLPKALKDGRLDEFLRHPYFAFRSINRAMSRDLADINAAVEMGQMTEKNLKKADLDLTLNNYLFLATQLGDMGGVILNGWAIYTHHVKEGLSKPEAANLAVAHIDRTQQSARVTQQIGMALDPNPLVRAFTSFTHAPMQYASILVQQLDTIGTERFSPTKFARTFAVYFALLPMLYEAVGRAFLYRKEEMPQYMAEFALGPFDEFPLAGGVLRVLATRAIYNYYKNNIDEDATMPYGGKWENVGTGLFGSMIKNIQEVERALTKEYEDGISLADFLEITTQLAEASAPIGGMYSGLARTVSAGAEGIALMSEENMEGTTVNSVRRLLMSLGYSAYATRPTEE